MALLISACNNEIHQKVDDSKVNVYGNDFDDSKFLSVSETIQNLQDSKSFNRNFKARDILITSDETGFSVEKELENQNSSSQWIDLNTTTSTLVIEILSAYSGQESNGADPFPECAIQEIEFYGRS